MNPSLDWQPSASIDVLKQRAHILQSVRQFFARRNVLEVETPLMCQAGVTDIHLHAFKTDFYHPQRTSKQTLFMQTSPEFAMKRLLSAGSGCIYQIAKAFRNEEAGRYHNPEFSILEWYRVGFDHLQLVEEIDELLQQILGTQPLEKLTYQAAFQQHCGIDPLSADLTQLQAKACDFGFDNIAQQETSKDVLLQLLCSQVVEPKIGQTRPVALIGFPRSQAALARIDDVDPRVARRFEIYFRGIELANGYHELANPLEQRQRFEQDNQLRQQMGNETIVPDERFLQAMQAGLPDCAGVALGLDRLMMLACQVEDIACVISFAIDRA